MKINKNASLRDSILLAAIHGELTLQLPEDGSALSVVKTLETKHRQLTKKKKGASYTFSEPELDWGKPKNWVNVRLTDIGTVFGGGTPSTLKSDYWQNGTIEWITPADMSGINGYYLKSAQRKITKAGLDSSSATLLEPDSIVMSSRAPIGYLGINTHPVCTSQGCKSLTLFDTEAVDPRYVLLALKAMLPEIISVASTMTFKEISGGKFGEIVIPFPPTKEQVRIADKMEKLWPLLCEYERLLRRKEELNQTIQKKLRNSIIEYATNGLLFPNLGETDDAMPFIKQVKATKDRLVEEGVMKKPKANRDYLPSDYAEIPALPKGWHTVPLCELYEISPRTSKPSPSDLVSFLPMERIADKFADTVDPILYPAEKVMSGFTAFANGDVLMAKITPCFQNGKAFIARNLQNGLGFGTTELIVFRPILPASAEYLFLYIQRPSFIQDCKDHFSGTAGQQRVRPSYLQTYPIAVPPLDEQERIVKETKALFACLKQI